MSEPAARRMPAIFLAHGSPLLLDDAGWVRELNRWAQALPRPESVLMLSDEPGRGLDHGAYVPLVAMYLDASVPRSVEFG